MDVVQTGEAVEEGRLSVAAGDHDGDDLATLHVEAYTSENMHLDLSEAVCFVYVLCEDDRVC